MTLQKHDWFQFQWQHLLWSFRTTSTCWHRMMHHRLPLPGASDRHRWEDTPLHPGLWLWNTSIVLPSVVSIQTHQSAVSLRHTQASEHCKVKPLVLVWGTPHCVSVEVKVCGVTAVHVCDPPLSAISVKQGKGMQCNSIWGQLQGEKGEKNSAHKKRNVSSASQCQRLSLIFSKYPRAEQWTCSYWTWQCFPLWWKILLMTNFGAQKTYTHTALHNNWIEGEGILFLGHVFNWQEVCSG